jgi:prolyl 4-hydroxylase
MVEILSVETIIVHAVKVTSLLFLGPLTCIMIAATEPDASFGAPYQRRTETTDSTKGSTSTDEGSNRQPVNDHQRSTSTPTRRNRRPRGLTNLCDLRTVTLLLLLLIVRSTFLVYQFSTKSTTAGEGIADVDTTPPSEREPRVVRLQDSDRVSFDTQIPPEYSVYHSLNQEYPGIERIQDGPPIYLVHDFLSDHEADFLINVAESCLSRSLVGGDKETAGRTSESCYFEQYHLSGLMEKVTSLTGKPLEHCEYPQVAKYVAGEQYGQHFDGFSNLGGPTGRKELTLGGNRLVTVLIYLNNVDWGGETHFIWTDLRIRPTKGTALVFFPSTADGEFDVQTMHAALPAVDTKYVSQIWVRENIFTGNPRKPPKHLSPEEVAGWSS